MGDAVRQTGSKYLDALRDHRALLLACEAIDWLHMTGKAQPDFLRHPDKKSKDWVDRDDVAWNDRLAWFATACQCRALKLSGNLANFCKQYDEADSKQSLVGLLQAGHGMASGIEKQSYAKGTDSYLGQDVTHMWLTTAFGHPVRNLLADPPAVLASDGWDDLIKDIGVLLDDLARLGTSAASVEDWDTWRDAAIGRSGWLRNAFLSTLAETRIPNNDVTLWDQSYVASALFKSAVAGAVLSIPDTCQNANWERLKPSTRWRVLTVGFGAEHYETHAVRIGD